MIAARWRFCREEELHAAALRMVVAGGLVALAFLLAGRSLSRLGPLDATAPVALLAATVVGAARWSAKQGLGAAVGRALLVAVGSLVALGILGSLEPWLGVAAFGMVVGLVLSQPNASGDSWRGLAVAAGVSSVAAALARYVLTVVVDAATAGYLPGGLADMLGGLGFAAVALLGLLPRHVERRPDEVTEAWAGLRRTAPREVGELLDRVMNVWRQARASGSCTPAARAELEQAARRLLDLTRRWLALSNEAEGNPVAQELAQRRCQLEERLASTSDPVARAYYERAQAALGEQLRCLEDCAVSRDRVMGQLHYSVALMEQLCWSIVSQRSADVLLGSEDLRPLLEGLDALGQELVFHGAAAREVQSLCARGS
jgi:hypothetical protein